jgi:DNA-binding transcriptional LysR family regulator
VCHECEKKAKKKIISVDFKILDVFLEAARYRSFREAEIKGKYKQARITQCMDQLEEFLGVKLFNRNQDGRRQGSLTPKGREFRDYAKRLVSERNKMVSMFQDTSAVRGIVRIGVSESIVHTWLPMLLERVQADYPDLGIEIEVDISPKLRDLLVAGELNLAFILEPGDGPELRSRPLCRLPVVFIASQRMGLPQSVTLKKS